ncbi:glycosyltransferase family 4 protein [Pseudonocardia sp. Cha107L01]|uniref:glycosyltransferase family 4 protein n=1 Tax=Pseudonocardia sp. Cha107L01 TaxID=3457576 RepID=UPI00403EBD04
MSEFYHRGSEPDIRSDSDGSELVGGQAHTSTPLDVLVMGMHYAPEHAGNAPYTTGLARALLCAGHRVRVVTGYPHYPGWKIAEGYSGLRISELDHGIPVTRVRHPVPSTPTARRRVVMDLGFALHAATVTGRRPDVVVAVTPVLLTVAAALRWKRRGRTALGVVTQDLYSRALLETGMMSARCASLAAGLERSLLNCADGIAVVHENFIRNLSELGVDRPTVSVIRNWSHVAPARTGRSETRRKLGWGPDEVIALHAGNMGVKQGLENVIEAARRADDSPDAVRFVLLGDGGQRRLLQAAGVGVRSAMFLDPLQDGDFEDALAAADVLVLNEAPTVAEMSAPSKLTSYFAAGRPVVAATDPRSAASREIERSQGGVRVSPGDPAALFHAVATLGRDPARGQKLGDRGRRYAQQYLTADFAARAYCEWVEKLAWSR